MVSLESEPASRSRVERRKEKTRRILMEVALGLFYEKGLYWTKIEDITESADIGKGTFYQYFATKEALIRALLERGLSTLLVQTEMALRGVKPGAKAIARIVQARLDYFLENPEYLLLFHQVRGLLQLKTKPAEELREVYNQYFDQLAKLIRPSLNGRPGSAAARDLALALTAFTSGLLTHQLLFSKEGDYKRRRETVKEQLERGLQALL